MLLEKHDIKIHLTIKGVLGGFKIITLLLFIEGDVYCTIFHIHSKTGSYQKDNLSLEENNKCKELIKHLIEEIDGE